METTLTFDLSPLDQFQRKGLIERLSDDWAYIDGTLTHSLENKRGIALLTEMILRERRLNPEFVGVPIATEQCGVPEIVGILTKCWTPGEVRFIQAGSPAYHGDLTFAIARDVAAYYVGLGYAGHLLLASRDRFGQGPLHQVRIALGDWQDGSGDWQPPQIRIDIDPKVGNEDPLITSTLSLCSGLKRYEPEREQATA